MKVKGKDDDMPKSKRRRLGKEMGMENLSFVFTGFPRVGDKVHIIRHRDPTLKCNEGKIVQRLETKRYIIKLDETGEEVMVTFGQIEIVARM